MKSENKIRLEGRAAFLKPAGDIGTKFSLSFYNGKDKDGKSQYGDIQCMAWNDCPGKDLLADRVSLIVEGYVKQESWADKATGQVRKALVLVAKSIKPAPTTR